MSGPVARVDVITAEIIRNGLIAAAVEMSRTLVRTAHNPLLYEAKDYCTAIVSPEGLLWAVAEEGVTTFLGALPDTVKTGLDRLGQDGFSEGDVLIANDPYLTGSHLSDVSIYAPTFFEGELVAFAATTAHWADVGGKSPGGWCPDSTDVYQEGVCFTHQRLIAAGEPNEALWELIESNVRFPALVLGDLEAQIAACRQGEERIQALCRKYGVQAVRDGMEFAIARADEAIRSVIAAVPDGTYEGGFTLDSDGVTPGERPRVQIALTVEGDRMRVSFAGTSEAARGPINDPAIATKADVRAALKGLLLPLDPVNEGHFLAIDFDLPPGLVVSPERPAPCDSYGYVGVALVNAVFQILARAMPDGCPSGGYQLFGIFLFRSSPRDGPPFILIDVISGGEGARPFADGPTLTFVGNGDVRNTPVEVIETRYPVRIERFEFLPEVAGAGKYRGGLGMLRDYRVLEAGTYMQIAIENVQDTTARGLHGGRDGEASAVVVWPGTDKERRMQERTSHFGPFAPGDVVRVRSGGGGGWGDPLERDPELVARDVRDGLLTPDQAAALYGVAVRGLDETVHVDLAATEALRREQPAAGPRDRLPKRR